MKSNRPVQKQVEKARETKWVPNFQKHRYLDDKLHEQIKTQHKEQTQARNSSPGALNRKRTTEGKFSDDINFEEAEEEEQLDTSTMPFSRKSTNQEISDTDLIMFGMYRLNTEQEEIYRKFVDMLTGFSQFDKVRSIVYCPSIVISRYRRALLKMLYMKPVMVAHKLKIMVGPRSRILTFDFS